MNPADPFPGSPWAFDVLGAGAIALVAALYALGRRRLGEAGIGFVIHAGAVAAIVAEIGWPRLGLGILWVAIALAAGVLVVAEAVRATPGGARAAGGNPQRALALAVTGLLTVVWVVAGGFVDWPSWQAPHLSALAVSLALGGAGIVGVLTRRHWLSLLLATLVVQLAILLSAVALPGPIGSRFAPAVLVWTWALGTTALLVVTVSVRRGTGPFVDRTPGAGA